ncbi:M23 family metallopeptidase [Parasphingorhabdus sp.]|uniref:M23 family metallopeptidase n=1 Tax=Parasphingorhabdus sp. TaxID=2709688 RepID=UPI0032EB8D9C
MTLLNLSTFGLQIVLPFFLIVWVSYFPAQSRIGLFVQILGTVSVLLALLLAAVWIIPPWWVPYGYLALLTGKFLWNLPRAGLPVRWLPQDWRGWFPVVSVGALGIWSATVAVDALNGREPQRDATIVNLDFPLGPSIYLVASGGASASVNGHFLTLNPTTERQSAYRGQSYAVDLIKINRWGLRASGWRPSDPAAYAIFGEPVFAPCEGEVLSAADGMPDMRVPITDTSRLEGNHVVLKCGDKAVLLAHLREGSVSVVAGQAVRTGTPLGQVGNSGQSTEPHLHIHTQRLPAGGPVLSGEPLHLNFEGRFLVRNDRLHIG